MNLNTLDPCPEGFTLRWHPWVRRYLCLPEEDLPQYEQARDDYRYGEQRLGVDYDPLSDWLDDPLPEELYDAGYPYTRYPRR